VTSTSSKAIPPKTQAKLILSEEYLMDMRKVSESSERFRKNVANFLTATRSVKDVLINEIAAGDKAVKAKIKVPIQAQMNADSEMKKLVKTRNTDIHEGDFALTIVWLPEQIVGPSGDPALDDFWRRHRARRIGVRSAHRSRIVGMPEAVEQIPRAFFYGITDRDAYAVCAGHLRKVRDAAQRCAQVYG
jgi:hypothetical protein